MKVLVDIITFKLLIIICLSLSFCANPGNLTGGPKDTKAPEIVATYPPNRMINFSDSKIELVFDEYIKFQNTTNAVLISPPIDPSPSYKVKGKSLFIDLPSALSENTTYTFNFLNSVSDYTEGNTMSTLLFLFSTGPYIDSLSVRGKVLSANDLSPAVETSVMLYRDTEVILDSVQPIYQIQTDGMGSFVFNNIKEGVYKIGAVNDKNNNRKADLATEEIGFISNNIDLATNLELVEQIRMFKNYEELKLLKVSKQKHGELKFAFNNPVQQIRIDNSLQQESDLAYFNEAKDTLTYWYAADEGMAKFILELNDSISDTAEIDLETRNSVNKLRRVSKPKEIHANEDLVLEFDAPINRVIQEGIFVKNQNGEAVAADLNFDRNALRVQHRWKEDSVYTVLLGKGAILSYKSDSSQIDSLSFLVLEEEIYPTLSLKTDDINEYALAYLFNDSGEMLDQRYFNVSSTVSFEALKPGKYAIRVIEDNNLNGKWDTGDIRLRKQPERVLNYTQDIEVKSNWDKELDIEL